MTSDPTYRDLLYFLKLLYTTVFAVTASLAPFYWGCLIFLISYIWIDTICPALCLQCRNSLGPTGCVTSLVMIGKSVCPSCQKQHKRIEYYCMLEIYRGITLLASEEDTEAAGHRMVKYIYVRLSVYLCQIFAHQFNLTLVTWHTWLTNTNTYLFYLKKKKIKKNNPSYVYCARLTETCQGTCILLLSRWSDCFYCSPHLYVALDKSVC